MNDVHSPACRGCQSAQDTLDNNPIDNSRALTRRSTNYSDEQTYPKAHRMERHVPPLWTYGDDNNRKLNEQVYITEFINTNQVRCINNQLYSPDGAFEDGRAKQLIIDDIMPYVKSNHGDKAKKLLQYTDLRIQEIAVQCGYQNVSHFMRQFKDKCGITAMQYRKQST